MYGLDRVTGFFEAFTMGNWMYLIATFCYFVAATCFFLILYEIYKILNLTYKLKVKNNEVSDYRYDHLREQLNEIHAAIMTSKVEYRIDYKPISKAKTKKKKTSKK